MLSNLRRAGALLALAASTLLAAAPAAAGPYSSLTVFGDSLSDTGNILAATGGAFPMAPYQPGRFSDGPVWIDVLAAGLGLPMGATPSLLGGSNYAYGGARTGLTGHPLNPFSPPGVLKQVQDVWAPAHASADANGLYVVVGGGNDMRDARSAVGGNDSTRQAAAEAAAQNIEDSVALLASLGARTVMISTLPDLGATPEAFFLGDVADSSDATARYNQAVWAIEGTLEALYTDLDVIVFDMAGIAAEIRANPAAYGFTNVGLPCDLFPPFPGGPTGGACSTSLFSDSLHPSAAAHAILGAAALAQAVPVPATLPLLALGLVGLVVVRRRVH
jgi:outer membrane lipase/esterase